MTMEEIDASVDHSTPVWAVFGDLMSGLLGAFVLILVGVLGVQLDLVTSLEAEIQKRQQEEQRREALEKALAGPLASGRVTLNNGKIGISGNVLFALNSDQLQPEGKQLLKSLSQPIAAYLGASEQMLMVSGFTDDMPVRGSNSRFADNWELSAQRALTVTRTLIEDGVPASSIFAAAFGAQQPVADNADAEGPEQRQGRQWLTWAPWATWMTSTPNSTPCAPTVPPTAIPFALPTLKH